MSIRLTRYRSRIFFGNVTFIEPFFEALYSWNRTIMNKRRRQLKVLGKSVGLFKTTKRKNQLYISLLVSVWRIICENFNPNGLILAEI